MADVTIQRDKAWLYEWDISRKDEESGVPCPIPPASTVRAWLSATPKGAPLTPASVITLERGALELRVDARRLWFGVLGRDLVTAALASITTGDLVYEVLEVDGERDTNTLTVSGAGGPSAPAGPAVAVFSNGAGGWEIRDGNTSVPDAFITTPDAGATFVIDPLASSGLPLAIVNNRPQIMYP